jgi:hypothetical protein
VTVRTLDTGNRAFWSLVAVSLVVRALIVYGVCCLAVSIFDTVREDGLAALWAGHPSLLPGVLVLVLTLIGVMRGSWSFGRSVWHTRVFARMVRGHLAGTPPRLRVIADRLGIGARLTVVELARPFALTYGITRARVLVSTGLLASLTDSELGAVLAHERAHLRSRDPLKNLLARAIPARHFYLPGLSNLRRRFTAGRELAADRAALEDQDTGALAGALLKVTEGPTWTKAPAAAMATSALLDVRIAQLETGAEPHLPASGAVAAGTAGGVLAFAAAAVWSAMIVAHAMPLCMVFL